MVWVMKMKNYKVWYRGLCNKEVFEIRVNSPKEGKKIIKALVKYDNHLSKLIYERPFRKKDAVFGIDFYNRDLDDWES